MTIAHGEHRINIQDGIIYLKLIGSFNDVGAKNFTRAMKEAITTFKGASFSILVDDLEVIGGTPEAYAELEKYNQWLNTQNMCAKAMVIDSPVTLAIIEKYAPSRDQQNISVFNNQTDAVKWLKTQQ